MKMKCKVHGQKSTVQPEPFKMQTPGWVCFTVVLQGAGKQLKGSFSDKACFKTTAASLFSAVDQDICQDQTFPERLKKNWNLEKAINKKKPHRSEVRPQFFPSEVSEDVFPSGEGRSVLLHLSLCRQGAKKQRKVRNKENIHSSSCICALFILSGAGNLPRNGREH